MKTIVNNMLSRTLLRPPVVRHCSQTLYEALLATLRMWDATGEQRWRARADTVLAKLLEIQQPDGGFDIGYEFNFGRLHRRGESTSPELVGLIALCQYGRRFGLERVEEPARRAAAWIGRHASEGGDGSWAIPYAPHSTSQVMIYNGTSFAAGALGAYLGTVEDDPNLSSTYAGMVRYLDGVMSRDPALPGRFWYYADQTRTDLPALRATKIDYYHQMQQVEVHALAEQCAPVQQQLALIKDAADHVVALQEMHDVIPYTENKSHFGGMIHTWGLASVIPGMLEAACLLPERAQIYQGVARRVLDWLLDHAWTGERFFAVLTPEGEPVIRDYMVRSDGWVLNAMASACVHLAEGPWNDVIDPCFRSMESVDFSGPETHASTPVKRATNQAIEAALRLTSREAGKP